MSYQTYGFRFKEVFRLGYVWPIALVIISNIVYQISAKSVPSSINPLASLTITYAVAAVASGALYFLLNRNANLVREYTHLNWAPFVLGIVVVGLEVGFIYAYKVGWTISTASIVQSAFLAVALIAVGFLLYQESITWTKVIGVVICLIGLIFINR